MNARDVEGVVFDVKELSVHDGPGTRVTVFLKGCPLRCVWCHNPEGLSPQPELLAKTTGCTHCGRCRVPCSHPECAPFGRCLYACPNGLLSVCGEHVTAGAIADRVLRLADFLRADGGGVTLSGGEVLMQPDFAEAVLRLTSGVHRVIQTSGYAPAEVFRRVALETDLVLFDIKHADPARHRVLTGVDNAPIFANLAWLRASGRPFVLRVPVIPGCNDEAGNLEAVAGIAEKGGNLVRVELLRSNPYAGAKYPWVGRKFTLAENAGSQTIDPEPFLRRGIKAVVL